MTWKGHPGQQAYSNPGHACAGAPVQAAVLASSPHDLSAMAERLACGRLLSAAFWCNEAIVGRWAPPPDLASTCDFYGETNESLLFFVKPSRADGCFFVTDRDLILLRT